MQHSDWLDKAAASLMLGHGAHRNGMLPTEPVEVSSAEGQLDIKTLAADCDDKTGVKKCQLRTIMHILSCYKFREGKVHAEAMYAVYSLSCADVLLPFRRYLDFSRANGFIGLSGPCLMSLSCSSIMLETDGRTPCPS